MVIIGHRGAAGIALENTLESLRKAISLGVAAVEFDVHLTRDRKLVLSHDADLGRVSPAKSKIAELDYVELKRIKLNNGEVIPSLEEALDCIGSHPAIVEVKVENCEHELLAVLDKFPKANVSIASFKYHLAEKLKKVRPKLKVYLAGFIGPSETYRAAKRINANGLDLNFWALNIITYKLARRANMDVMVYTVNYPWIARFINWFYKDIAFITDHPERFLKPAPTPSGATKDST